MSFKSDCDFNDFDEKRADFIYQNAIDLWKSLEESIQHIKRNAVVLLGYLLGSSSLLINYVVGFCALVAISNTGIVERRNVPQFFFDLVAHLQCVNKVFYALLRDGRVRAGQVLERFVWLWITFASQDGLNAFCYHCPRIVQIRFDGNLVQQQLV